MPNQLFGHLSLTLLLVKLLYPGIESKIVAVLAGTSPLLCVSVTLVRAGKRHLLLRMTGARAFLTTPHQSMRVQLLHHSAAILGDTSQHCVYTYATP